MSQPQPVTTLAGEHVAIGPLRRDLLPLYHVWINNPETTQFLGQVKRVTTLDEEISWFEAEIRKPDVHSFTIYHLPTYQPIGTVDLHQINLRHRTAHIGIMIGEVGMRGKGLGTETIQLVLDYGFNTLELNNIGLVTDEFNLAGQRTYQKVGFTEVGRRRKSRFHGGRFWDEIHMDMLASEFTASRLKTRLAAHTVTRVDTR